MDTYKLCNGIEIPIIGMGTWPLAGENLERLMKEALSIGYRMFDTADNYFNEDAIGNVLHRNGGMRDEIFILTKISDEKKRGFSWSSVGKYFYKTSPYMQSHTAKEVVHMLVETSLRKLKTDYIDCLIIHWPYPDYFLEIWEAMIGLYREGKLRAIGVSNCRERHLEMLKQNFTVLPMVNQISISPLDTKRALVEHCKKENIQLVCYAPLMQIKNSMLAESEIMKNLSHKYRVDQGRLLLMWNKAQHIIPIPKSSHVERLKANFDFASVSMTSEDVELICSLNEDMQYLPESLFCPGI